MASNTVLNRTSGGDSICATDLSPFTGYSNSGKLQGVSVYFGSGSDVLPTPLSNANPMPCRIVSGMDVIGQVGISSGLVSILSGQLAITSGNIGAQVSGAVIVSGNVGVSGSVQLLSGSAQVGVVEGVYSPVAVAPASGQAVALQTDAAGKLLVAGVNVSQSVQVSGTVAVSGAVQILSGSAWIGIPLGVFNPVAVGPASGQPFPLQLDGSGRLITAAAGGTGGGGQTSGAVQVSGIVGISGQVGILSGQIAVSSGLVGILSGSIGAQISGAVQISGNVGVSGSVQLLSGSSWIGIIEGVFSPVAAGPASGQPYAAQMDGSGNLRTSLVNPVVISGSVQVSGTVQISGLVAIQSGLIGVLSGSIGAQVSGALIVSGNVGVSGSVQLLSGSASVGVFEGIFSPVAVGPASGQVYPIQIDGSGNQRISLVNPTIVSGSVQVSGIVGISGQVGILSGLIAVLSGAISASVSGIVGISGSVNVLSGQIAISSGLVGILSGSVGAQVSGAVIVSGNVQVLSGSALLGNIASVPSNSGGYAIFRAFSGLTNTSGAIGIKSGASQLVQVGFANNSASGMFLKIWDNTAAPTVGTTAPILSFFIGVASGLPTWNNVGQGNVGLQINNGLWATTVGVVSGFLDQGASATSGQSGQVMAWFVFRSGF